LWWGEEATEGFRGAGGKKRTSLGKLGVHEKGKAEKGGGVRGQPRGVKKKDREKGEAKYPIGGKGKVLQSETEEAQRTDVG